MSDYFYNAVPGDIDLNGSVDVSDIVVYVNVIMGLMEPSEDQFIAGDVNFSGEIDILDVVMTVDIILY